MTQDNTSNEWLRVSKLFLNLFQLPEQQLNAIFMGLPREDRAKIWIRAAFQFQMPQRLQQLEKAFSFFDAGDIFSALQIVSRDNLEELVLYRLEQEGNLGESARYLVDSLSEKELQNLTFIAILPRDKLIFTSFIINSLSPDRRNQIINSINNKMNRV
jgi:hypothetical protein